MKNECQPQNKVTLFLTDLSKTFKKPDITCMSNTFTDLYFAIF